MNALKSDPYWLNRQMNFDGVVQVISKGVILQRHDIYAPDLHVDDDGSFDLYDGWTLMNGYSGQDRYSGPLMHQSEFIGGRMADDIADDVGGIYVALVAYPYDDSEPTEWAVARRND